MQIDLSDPQQVRSRYIGTEIYFGMSGVTLHNRTGFAVFPPDVITLSEIGLPWIDRGILKKFKRPRIFTELIASLENSEYQKEVEHFIQNTDYLTSLSWKGIYYQTGHLDNACRIYENTTKILGDSPEWLNADHHVICVDQEFLIAARLIFDVFVKMNHGNSSEVMPNFIHNFFEVSSADVGEKVTASNVRRLIPAAYMRRNPAVPINFDEIFGLSRDEERSVREFSELFRRNRFVENLFAEIGNRYDSRADFMRGLSGMARSMNFHFISGHELGHVSFSAQKRSRTFHRIVDRIRKYVGDVSLPQLEECYCDYIGLENCLYQAKRFNVPLPIAFVATQISWHMTNYQNQNTDMFRSRLKTIRSFWIEQICAQDRSSFQPYFDEITSFIQPALRIMRSRLDRVSNINLTLNPTDESFVRTLNTRVDIYLKTDEETKIAEIHVHAY